MRHLVIISPLAPLTVGASFAESQFPLHMTLAPPFRIGCDLPTLSLAVRTVSREIEPMLAEVTGQEKFGPDLNIAVAVVRPLESLLNAHARLIEGLIPLGWAAKEPQHNGKGFRPHITANDNTRVRLGEQLILGEIALIEMIDLPIVRATFSLSKRAPMG